MVNDAVKSMIQSAPNDNDGADIAWRQQQFLAWQQ